MTNPDDFSKRLTAILDHYGLSASAFADLIHVQRSSISHVLSGRNKPSLDFILKLNTACPDINLYWFLNGKGHITTDHSPAVVKIPDQISSNGNKIKLESEKKSSTKIIDSIVMFYKDGTFRTYSNSDDSNN